MTEFDQFIQTEVENYKRSGVPVNASWVERLFVGKVACTSLHPNPEDEFCFPDIGPNYGIITSYEEQFRYNLRLDLPLMDEPVIVQKIRPHGYMLLNGHHRWAAALRIGIKKIPVSIVNSVFESDIREMLERSVNEKRATLDLDEVVFRKDGDSDTEKAPGLFRFGIHRKKMRLGIPVLFRYLKKNGCDIWVYSADFYSIDDIRSYFKRYGVTVDGIITGTKKKRKDGKSEYEGVENLITGKYKETIHIDNDMVLITHSQSKDFEDAHIDCESGQWASSVIEAVENSGKA